jgi:hypothetical protein
MIIDVSDHFEYDEFSRDIFLDSSLFRLIFRYNDLFDYWTLEIRDAGNLPLWIGKLVCNFDLLARYKTAGLPRGKLIAETTDLSKAAVQKEDFKEGKVVIRYMA